MPARKAGVAARHDGSLVVRKSDAIHDGKGGFLPVGAKFDAVDDEAAKALKARGFAE